MQKVAAHAAAACTINSTKVEHRQRVLAVLRNHLFCLLSALTRSKYEVADVVSCLQAANETFLQEQKKHQLRMKFQDQSVESQQSTNTIKNEFSQSLIEQIWMKNAEHSAISPDSNVLSWSLKQFISKLLDKKVVTIQELKEQLDPETLAHCSLIKDKDNFDKAIKSV